MPTKLQDSTNETDATEDSSSAKRKAEEISGDSKTPYEEYFDKFNAFVKRHDCEGAVMVQGIVSGEKSDDEEEEEKEESDDKSKYTNEQMQSLRYILINNSRDKEMDAMRKFVLGDQAESDFMMFNTSFSYGIHDGFYRFKAAFGKKKSWPKKFDMLCAYTKTIGDYDVWMHDNESGMDDMVKDLAAMWKRLLKKSDKELGIDSEYTRPGILAMLAQFKSQIEDCCSEPPFRFTYE